MFQCIRCPTAYHFHGERGTKSTKDDAECTPAGCILLGGTNIVCPAHFQVPYTKEISHWKVNLNGSGCITEISITPLGINCPVYDAPCVHTNVFNIYDKGINFNFVSSF